MQPLALVRGNGCMNHPCKDNTEWTVTMVKIGRLVGGGHDELRVQHC
jgi:hypothetical protein